MKVFNSSPPIPASVLTYTTEKFKEHNSASTFISEFLQKSEYGSKGMIEKRALRIMISDLYKYYTQFCHSAKLGPPQIRKKFNSVLTEQGFTIVRSKHGMQLRGVIINTEKWCSLVGLQLDRFSSWFNENMGMSMRTYNELFIWKPSSSGVKTFEEVEQDWTGSRFMKPISFEENFEISPQVDLIDENENEKLAKRRYLDNSRDQNDNADFPQSPLVGCSFILVFRRAIFSRSLTLSVC